MRGCRRLLLVLAVMATWGCRQGPHLTAQIDLMNAEKRALEDQLYELEFDYEEARRQVEKLKKENERLRTNSGTTRGSRRDSTSDSESSRDRKSEESGDLSPPMIDEGMMVEPQIEIPSTPSRGELPSPQSTPAPQPAAPEVPPVSPITPKANATPKAAEVPKSSAVSPSRLAPPSRTSPPRSATILATPPGPSVFTKAPSRELSLEPGDPRVTHLFLNQQLTGGSDFDRQPGDDGIVVVLEPRNAAEAFVPLAGPLTILVLDPAKQPQEGRIVARWEVDANEAQRALQNTAAIRGIHLRLPWPSGAPQTNRLHLYVRYLTVDNREIRVDREIFLTLPGQFSQRWTPRATPRGSAAATLAEVPPSQLDSTAVDALPEPEAGAELPAETPKMATPEWRPYR